MHRSTSEVGPKLQPRPFLDALVQRARSLGGGTRVALVHPCDVLAMEAAFAIAQAGVATPVLVGPSGPILAAADLAGVDARAFEHIEVDGAMQSAWHAAKLARDGAVGVLMKGALHTDELMSMVVHRDAELRGATRMSHVSLFDLPRYPKLLSLTDCGVNIAPDLHVKRDIVTNAVRLLQALGVARPKVGIVAAVETVNPAIRATLDAAALVQMAIDGAWPGAIVEGPLGLDNAISSEAARIKKIESRVCGDADLLVVPDLNSGNALYKAFGYIGGGDCASLVVGARVPVALTSRADSIGARVASAAAAVLSGGAVNAAR
ncbi:MAG: bifunctional enoyl-CoA hydratase/phosphate acetyltransferase [Betaproteobacteria bacterium]|jgi:phosphate acetyltransferase